MRKPKPRTLRPIRPNAGIEAAYRRRLRKLIEEMVASTEYWLRAAYNQNRPELAQDASPASILHSIIRRLARRWLKRFNDLAPQLARYFATSVHTRSEATLKRMLRDAGFAVEFRMTPAMQDVFTATVRQNVALIRSIPSRYFQDIEGMVMRSVQTGRDLHQLSGDLRRAYGVSRRRADLIARDQSSKSTSVLTRARQVELGFTEAIWMHSHAGKEPRPTHVANDGKRFSLVDGWFDPDKRVRAYILPGTLINCRCTARPIIPGL